MFAEDITSANIVGYNTIAPNPDATETPCFGLCFAPVQGEKQLLGSFKPADGTSEFGTDMIQVLNPDTQDPDFLMSYCDETVAAIYVSLAGGQLEDYVGWWFDGYDPGDQMRVYAFGHIVREQARVQRGSEL